MGTASLLVFVAFAMFFAAGARIFHLVAILAVTVPVAAIYRDGQPVPARAHLCVRGSLEGPAELPAFISCSRCSRWAAAVSSAWGWAPRAQNSSILPEQYTDFIFSVLGEELGLIGTFAVVVLFVTFAYRAVRIAIAAPDRFGFFIAIGCAAMIVIQAFINIGVVTSSWPVTGVPLAVHLLRRQFADRQLDCRRADRQRRTPPSRQRQAVAPA